MIAIKLQGRLGNQLFQYAFVYAAASRLKTSFYIDKSLENFLLPAYFEIKDDWTGLFDKTVFSITGYRNLFRITLRKAFYGSLNGRWLSNRKISIRDDSNPEKVLLTLADNRRYEGYFQSADYFNDFAAAIMQLYQVKKRYVLAFDELQRQMGFGKKKVVIHVRRTDYVDLNWILPLSYYKKAIANIDPTEVDFIFISDDPMFVKEEFKYLPNKYISVQNEIMDFQFLMHADICILSNSSFSWWGAWLNTKPDSVIYCPEYYLGYEAKADFPKNIYPDDWKKISY